MQMEQDCENWIKFKLMNCSIRMKKDAVPHLNLYVQEPLNEKQLQCLPAKKKKKSEFLEPNLQVITETPFSHIQQSHKAVQVHIKAVTEDKGIQVEIKKKTRSSGVNTISVTSSVATSPLKLPHEVPSGKSGSPLISITSSSSTQSHVTSDI
ncbi:uncharacterized protein LOC108910636 isoform X2 [Anoplophora glabripennis]|uniref:uncharacterized protein LOC108910636 isoform X2 n=1 Tax=Anoplophora glabripennis TaxID=217634 RepID=UPI0008745B6E|nr:uncharacterized protein LOC108910636 isoform X2 [Anoplophora glabripennis]